MTWCSQTSSFIFNQEIKNIYILIKNIIARGMNMSITAYQPEWIREDFIDFIAEKVHPTWAWKKVKVELISQRNLSDDFVELKLRPNQNFKQNNVRAGQSILVTLTLQGVRQQRSYSVVEITAQGNVVIAVKKQGRVSHALCNLKRGDVLEISQAQGDFLLDVSAHKQATLLLASGSGITAIYALAVEHLKKSTQSLDLIYFSRDDAYLPELQSLLQQYPQFKLHYFNTTQQQQHLQLELIQQYVPDFQQRMCYACGAAAMMKSAQQIYQALDIFAQLKTEFFQFRANENITAQPVQFLRAQQSFMAQGSLLDSAEHAGLKLASGCRMGVCNTCSCTKLNGSVQNMLTGEVSHEPNTQIKLCISQALTPVTINL